MVHNMIYSLNNIIERESNEAEDDEVVTIQDQLMGERIKFNILEEENLSLRKIINFAAANDIMTNASIVTVKTLPNQRTKYGIISDMSSIEDGRLVINQDGIVGRTKNKKVEFITHRNFKILAKTSNTRKKLVLSGNNGDMLKVLHIEDEANDGEEIMTDFDNYQGIPGGIKIGILHKQGALFTAKPYVDFARLHHVLILGTNQ